MLEWEELGSKTDIQVALAIFLVSIDLHGPDHRNSEKKTDKEDL